MIVVIVLISLYIGFLKRIKRKYSLEEIWAEEDAEKVRKVAKIQKELEDTLLFLRAKLYENMNSIQEQHTASRQAMLTVLCHSHL